MLEHIAFPSRKTTNSGATYPSPLQVLFVDELLLLISFDFGGHGPSVGACFVLLTWCKHSNNSLKRGTQNQLVCEISFFSRLALPDL